MARPLRALLGAVLPVSGVSAVATPAGAQTVEEPVVLQTTPTDDIGGDLTPEGGMHLVDVNVAPGDLIDIAEAQAAAWAADR